MYDRAVQYPNRIRLIPVEGTGDIFDYISIPGDVASVGTSINKNTLLKDSTAARVGLGADALPDDALNRVISNAENLTAVVNTKAAQSDLDRISTQVAGRCLMKAGYYVGDGNSSQVIDVGFPISAVLVENTSGRRNDSSNSPSGGGLAIAGRGLVHGTTLIRVDGTSFKVWKGGEYQGSFNTNGAIYYYVAWGVAPIE